jgi:hypothetical protein
LFNAQLPHIKTKMNNRVLISESDLPVPHLNLPQAQLAMQRSSLQWAPQEWLWLELPAQPADFPSPPHLHLLYAASQ